MIALPSLEQVLRALAEYGVTKIEHDKILYGPRGGTRVVYLLREMEGGRPLLSQPLPTDSKHLEWPTVDRLCRQLEIDPLALDVGVPRPPTWWSRDSESSD